MDRSRAIRQWAMLLAGIALMVLAARGALGSGLAALIVPQNMVDTSGSPLTKAVKKATGTG